MRKIFDHSSRLTDPLASSVARPVVGLPPQGPAMRAQLQGFLDRLARGTARLHLPGTTDTGVARGDGHFHLAAELFLQVAGWTHFRLPHGDLRLEAGEALLMPPRLLHAEVVGGTPQAPFRNLVVYAHGQAVSCHVADEADPGRADILHLEARRHAQAARIGDWLADAARFGRPETRPGRGDGSPAAAPPAPPWAEAQARALVAAAIAGVLRVLDDAPDGSDAEPPMITRLCLLVRNQLGDHELSVRRLAAQLGCSADYLSHRFSQSTGQHLVAYINRERMDRAARLLAETDMAGKEIAWACGFTTPSYFIRSFRAQFGTTPRAWRLDRQRSAPP